MRRATAFAVLALSLALPSRANATGSDTSAAAETLFREAKALMAAKNFQLACPKLVESMRLDPGTGTLLTLALCHESAGQTASAWAEFTEAVAPSRADGRVDRVQIATSHAAALEPKLVRIRVAVPDDVAARPNLVVTRDGSPVQAAVFNSAIPVDPGEHSIRVTDGGQLILSKTLEATVAGETYTVELSSEAFAHPAASEADSSATASGTVGAHAHPLLPLALAAGGAGVAGLVLGTIFGVQAISQSHSAKAMCPGDVCPTLDGINTNNRAKSAATISNIAFAAGGALAVTGIVLVLLPPSSPAAAEARVVIDRDGVTLGYGGTF